MKKAFTILLLAAALPLLASEANTVSAQGYACFLVLSDAATVNLNVNVWSKDISDLHKKSDESLAKLSRKLAKAGELAAIQGKSLGNLVDFGEAELSVGSRTFQSFGVVNLKSEDKVVRSPLPRLLMECKVTTTYELVE